MPTSIHKPENDVPCLGAASAIHGAQLQEFILHEQMDARAYQVLARQAPTPSAARILSTMSADERRHAKRLSTAYFLISGVRYLPEERAGAPRNLPYPALLRRHFVGEQRGEAAYRAAATATEDSCLREMYLELAQDENSHAWLLRGILEGM